MRRQADAWAAEHGGGQGQSLTEGPGQLAGQAPLVASQPRANADPRAHPSLPGLPSRPARMRRKDQARRDANGLQAARAQELTFARSAAISDGFGSGGVDHAPQHGSRPPVPPTALAPR